MFTYSVVDAGGLSSLATITITVTGQNDAPVSSNDTNTAVEAGGVSNGTSGTNPTGNVLTNDSDVDSNANGETKSVIGVVAGGSASASGSVGSSVTGTYGSISIAADGSYTYNVDNANAAVQALRLSSQTLTDTFTYTMTDTAGLTSTSTVTITIQGSNDNPVAIVDNSDAVEAGGVSNATTGSNGTGNVLTNDTDVDSNANGETKAVTGIVAGISPSAVANVGSTVTGTYGSIVLNSDGSYTYVVDNTNTAVQALRLNSQTLDDVFTYTVTDTGGLTSTTQLTVTVRGRNDNPVGVNDTATAVEAGGYANATTGTTPTGNVLANDTDVDSVANGETKTVNGVVAGASASASGSVGTSVTGTYGSINIASDGGYTYTVDNSNVTVQALRTSGQSLSEVFTYSVVDAGGLSSLATITITVTGQNDAPVSSNDTNTAVEAGGV
ncbi:MAG: beta strand repeat-containing protein, partial [bacterium]